MVCRLIVGFVYGGCICCLVFAAIENHEVVWRWMS